MDNTMEKIFFWIIAAGVCFILFIPLIISRTTLYPFIFGKAIAFRIAVEIIGAVYILLAILFPKYRPSWKNPLVLAVTCFIGVLFLSTLFGVDIHRSFWATQERMVGLFSMLHFWAFFIVLVSVFRARKQWHWLLRFSIFASLIVALYGLAQKLNIQKFIIETEEPRITGTIGNPNFIAAYLLFFIFLCVLLFIKDLPPHQKFWCGGKKWFWRVFYGLVAGFELLILIFSGTRSATVGLVVGVFVGFLLLALFSPRRKLRICFAVIFLILIGSISYIWLNKDEPHIKKIPYIGRFTDISFEAGRDRLIAWGVGWRGWKDRFILGWGPENYNVAFNKYYDPWYLEKGSQATWYDRAHNIVFDIGVTSGILGFLSYIAIFVAGFYVLWRKKKAIGITTSIILISLLIAYFVQNIFNFDTPSSFIAFFLVLGFIGYLRTVPEQGLSPKLQATSYKLQATSYKLQATSYKLQAAIAGLVLIILVPILIYQTNIKPLRASRLGVKGVAASQVDYQQGLAFFKESLDLGTFTNPEIRLQLAKMAIDASGKGYPVEDIKVGLKFATDETEKSVKEHPKDVRYYLFLGQLCNLMAKYDPSYLNRAGEILEKALELSPARQQVYFELAQTRMLQRDFNGGMDLLRRALILDPNVRESHWNLAMGYLVIGQYEEGLKEVKKHSLVRYRGERVSDIIYIANAYIKIGDYGEATSLYMRAIEKEPENADLYAKIASLWAQIGEKENAKRSAEKAAELDSRLKEQAEAFIKQLEE